MPSVFRISLPWARRDGTLPHDASLVDRVADHVRHHIASNRLVPGDMLPGEGEVSQKLEVSRPVVREAWNGLAALGLLEAAPGRRPRVARLIGLPMRSVIEQALVTGQASPLRVLELRRGIEVQMAGLAAERCDGPTLVAIEKIVDTMAAFLHDYGHYAELDIGFHRLIAKAAGNPFHLLLVEACSDVFEHSMRAGLDSRVDTAELQQVQASHGDILEAIRDRSPAMATSAMSRHFDAAMHALMRNSETERGT